MKIILLKKNYSTVGIHHPAKLRISFYGIHSPTVIWSYLHSSNPWCISNNSGYGYVVLTGGNYLPMKQELNLFTYLYQAQFIKSLQRYTNEIPTPEAQYVS